MSANSWMPKGIAIRGCPNLELQRELRKRFQAPVFLTMESQEIQKVQDSDDLLSLFVFKPDQTGFASVAEMTASAINNTQHTAVLSLPPDGEESMDQAADRLATTDILDKLGVPVFESIDEAATEINALDIPAFEAPVNEGAVE